jgi:tRNA dimethylallyltransferase
MTASRILIYGPTASGKSDLAMGLAERLGAHVVNADALQVYADLRILSARPSAADAARVPHRLYGDVDGAAHWSVGAWTRTVAPILAEDRPLILVGGTGLYFNALTRGLASIPPVPDDVRTAVDAQWDTLGEDAFRAELRAIDPIAETRILPHDRLRLTRAMAVARAHGAAISTLQQATTPMLQPGSWTGVVVAPPRATVIAAIERRWGHMRDAGVLDEVRAVAARDLPPGATMRTAHGLPHLLAHLHGAMTLDDAAALTIRDTRQYAKRQMTWARRYMVDWQWLTDETPDARAKALFTMFC